MTIGGETTHTILRIKNAFSPSGNLTLLERPFRRITLQSVVQVALRARHKQYEIRDLLEAQTTATQLRDEFISIASHELRTPLTSLKLQVQINELMMARDDASAYTPERVQKLVTVTGRQVDRLARLVDDMLDISRINNGRLVMQRQDFDLSELVREVVDRTLPQLQAANCPTELQCHESIVGSWDRYRLEQVLNNLLANAVQYCPGAPVRVSLFKDSTNSAVMVIQDEGPGIAASDQERIFTRFERATQRVRGLGLGLFICREIVEAHGGTIRVERTR